MEWGGVGGKGGREEAGGHAWGGERSSDVDGKAVPIKVKGGSRGTTTSGE